MVTTQAVVGALGALFWAWLIWRSVRRGAPVGFDQPTLSDRPGQFWFSMGLFVIPMIAGVSYATGLMRTLDYGELKLPALLFAVWATVASYRAAVTGDASMGAESITRQDEPFAYWCILGASVALVSASWFYAFA